MALTDTDNMFGALEFSEKLAGYGIQPIVGCALAIDFGDETRDPRSRAGAGVAADRAARGPRGGLPQPDAAQLPRLPGNAVTEKPHMKLAWLEGETDGLIALTGGPAARSTLPSWPASRPGRRAMRHLARLFGDRLYMELQRHGTPDERITEPR